MPDRRAFDRRGDDKALEAALKAAAKCAEKAETVGDDAQAEALLAHGLEGLVGALR